jgi:hypothetical protein
VPGVDQIPKVGLPHVTEKKLIQSLKRPNYTMFGNNLEKNIIKRILNSIAWCWEEIRFKQIRFGRNWTILRKLDFVNLKIEMSSNMISLKEIIRI